MYYFSSFLNRTLVGETKQKKCDTKIYNPTPHQRPKVSHPMTTHTWQTTGKRASSFFPTSTTVFFLWQNIIFFIVCVRVRCTQAWVFCLSSRMIRGDVIFTRDVRQFGISSGMPNTWQGKRTACCTQEPGKVVILIKVCPYAKNKNTHKMY